MKSNLLLPFIILFSLLSYQTKAQCPTGDLTLATQAQVDNFIATYPNCQNFIGNLTIGGASVASLSDINDISGLQLLSVSGNLTVRFSPQLASLDGLEMLTNIGGGFFLFDLDAITNVDDLGALSSIGRYLRILNNDGLTSISGFSPQLTFVGTNLNIRFNPLLTSLDGLQGITSVGGFVRISDNAGLLDMSGLNQLASITGDLEIKNNINLLSLNGLDQLEFVGGSVYLFANFQMASITGLANLVDVCGNFQIFKNVDLTNCAIGILCKFILDENFDLFLDESMDNCGTVENITNILNAANTDCAAATEAAVLCTPLSAELIGLNVRLRGRTATLTWETATETNNQGFEIQRSKDGSNWETISWQQGNGNSNTLRAYAYTDYNTYRGTNYYRLQQLDFDGAAAYSPAVSVTINSTNTIDIYPNPASDFLIVSGLDGRAIDEIIIHNITGKQALRRTNTNNIVDISSLPAGMYVAVIVAGFDEKFLKLVIE